MSGRPLVRARHSARAPKRLSIIHEVDPHPLGDIEYPLSVRDGFEQVAAQPFTELNDPFLTAGRAKVPTLARKGRLILAAAVFTFDPGKTAMQIAPVQIPVDHIQCIGAPKAVPAGISIIPDRFQFLKVRFETTIVMTGMRIAPVIWG